MKKLITASKENRIILSLGEGSYAHMINFTLDNGKPEEVYLYGNITVSKLYQALSEIIAILLKEKRGYQTLNTKVYPYDMDTITITIPITENLVNLISKEINDSLTIQEELEETIKNTINENGFNYDPESLSQIVHRIMEETIINH